MQGDRVKKLMFSYSDNVDKELKYNQYISISSIDSHASHTKEECSSKKTGIQSLQSVFCASTTQPKVTPANHHRNGGSITSLSPPLALLPSSSRWSSQCQLLHLNLSSGSFPSPAMWSPPRGPS